MLKGRIAPCFFIVIHHCIYLTLSAYENESVFGSCHGSVKQIAVAKLRYYRTYRHNNCLKLTALTFVDGDSVCKLKLTCIFKGVNRNPAVKVNLHKGSVVVNGDNNTDIAVEDTA